MELMQPEVKATSPDQIAPYLLNQANYMLLNSQCLMDILDDSLRLLEKFQKQNPGQRIRLGGMGLDDAEQALKQMLMAKIVAVKRISENADVIRFTRPRRIPPQTSCRNGLPVPDKQRKPDSRGTVLSKDCIPERKQLTNQTF